VNADDLKGLLARRSPGQWELFCKNAESREADSAAGFERTAWRREEGWAARWWEQGGPRFAAASNAADLAAAIPEAARVAVAVEPAPAWPTGAVAPSPGAAVDAAPALFADLSRAVAAAARGDAVLARLAVRRGAADERIANAGGLDVWQRHRVLDGVALCIGRRGSRAREVRLPFRWEGEPDLDALARRLADAATLPLSDRPAPFSSGQLLLDPAVGAALLAAIAPLFLLEKAPRWVARGQAAGKAVGIADDATRDAPFDGEGVPTRRVPLVADGAIVGRLHDLSSARRAGARPTGHGARPSFRLPPAAGPRRIFFEGTGAVSPAELLSRVTRGLFASALTAPARVDLAIDRYEIEFTGVSVVAGRAQGPVAGTRVSGRVSELLGRIAGLSTDLQFFPSPFPAGSPTLFVERASFS
jgi:predicted Zn-dependent protease